MRHCCLSVYRLSALAWGTEEIVRWSRHEHQSTFPWCRRHTRLCGAAADDIAVKSPSWTKRLALVVLALLLLAPRPAVGVESSTRPFRLAPATDLALSGPKESHPPGPCSGFTLFLADERPVACPRLAAADDAEPVGHAQGEEPPTQLQKPWPYRVLPYAAPVALTAAGLVTSLAG